MFMKLHFIALTLILATFLMAEEPSRMWTSKQGLTLQGALTGVESGMVLIKKPNGDIFKTKLDTLSEADINYVNAISFGTVPEPREASKGISPSKSVGDDLFGGVTSAGKVVEVTLLIDPNPAAPSVKELGASPRPKLNDHVSLKVSMVNRQNQDITPDSVWTIESLDSASGTLKSKTGATPPIKTAGLFYFLTYSVENNMQGTHTIPIPILRDSKNRKFYPLSASENNADDYLPDGMLSAEKDLLPPGLKKKFCSIYELPKDCTVSSIEVFPIRMIRHPLFSALIHNGQIQGKRISLQSDAVAPADPLSDNLSKAEGSTEKANVFMTCRPKTQKGTLNTYVKTRILAYSVDLRLTKPQQKEATIKAYFIAADSEGDAIADVVDENVSLQQGKVYSTAVESKPVSETSYYHSTYGSKLKGVIIQLWSDGLIVETWTSMPQWEKYAKMPDLQLKMRNVARRHSEFMNGENLRENVRPTDRRMRD